MSTFLNAYECLKQVRLALHVYDVDTTQGVQDDLYFNNDYLMQKINNAQRYVYNRIFNLAPERFLAIETATFSGSSYTLPWDFARLSELRDENGRKIHRAMGKTSARVASSGNEGYYYQQGNTLVLDKSGLSKNCTLIYYTKPRDMDQGRIGTTSAGSITLGKSAKKIADYYNGMLIENDSDSSDYVDTITDYTADRVATITATTTSEEEDVYGIVSELPEPVHFLIPIKAVIDIKLEHPLSKIPIGRTEQKAFDELLEDTLLVFGKPSSDITISEILDDFGDYNNTGYATITTGD